jgi:hypothetical protein
MPETGSRIEIIDIGGRIIASRKVTNPNEIFYFDQQTPGLYMVRTITGSREMVSKLIIN